MTRRREPAVEAERTLPNNLEAERSVLGAILLHNDAYETIAQALDSADFFRDAHRRIYEGIERLLEHPGGAVDLVTLMNDLAKHGDLEEVGGPSYIAALVDGEPRGSNVAHYAGIVREKATLRRIIAASNRITTAAYAAEEPAEKILHGADRALVDLQKDAHGGAMQSLATSHAAYRAALDYRAAHRGELTGLDTGFNKVNDLTMGWQRKDSIVLASRPSIGKTAFTLNTARSIAESVRPGTTERCHVAIFSLEMRRELLEDRLLSSLTGLQSSLLRGGYVFGDDQRERLSTGLTRLKGLGIHIDDTKGRNVHEIRAACRRLRSEVGLDAVVIDYVQLMDGSLDRRGATRNEELTDISRRLNIMFGELDVAGLILSQLKRGSADRPDPRPKLEDLRESGALEQDADLVVFLHRRNHKEGGVTQVIVEKARNGPTGTVLLTLDRDITRFEDYDGEAPAEPAKTEVEVKAQQASFFKRRAHAR